MLRAASRVPLVVVLAQSGVAVSHTGNTNETTLATIPIPAGLMGPNGSIRLTTVWSATNNANTKAVIIRLGGQLVANNAPSSFGTYREQRQITNRNSNTSQITFSGTFGGFGMSGAPPAVLNVNTNNTVNLTIGTQLANAGDTMTLQSYTVEVIPSF